ncbi:MAG TPA: hypothetical protein VGU25_01250 [Acidobacteriaceae bacterium]|nr:hypothetical protein [Acidobacteriaceae bacterium]
MLSPQLPTRVLLLAAVLGICDQSYWQYSDVDHYFTGYWMPFVHGTGTAPEQYRIGVKMAAWWLVQHLSWEFRYGFTLMDVIASVAGALLVYDLLLRRPAIRESSTTLQWFASAGLVLLVCYYMAWVYFFFRPETLPSFGLTACMAWLWTRRRDERGGTALTICGLVAAAAAQAWIRADVPCALNAGILLMTVFGSGRGLSISRRASIVTSAVCIAVAAGTQFYIMRVVYPHASYGNVPVFMVTRDLHQPLTFPPFLIFMLPVAWTAVQAWRQRAALDTGSRGLLLGAAIYFALWILMGKLDEVRIFIPFAVVLIPITMELAIRRISSNSQLNGRGVEV